MHPTDSATAPTKPFVDRLPPVFRHRFAWCSPSSPPLCAILRRPLVLAPSPSFALSALSCPPFSPLWLTWLRILRADPFSRRFAAFPPSIATLDRSVVLSLCRPACLYPGLCRSRLATDSWARVQPFQIDPRHHCTLSRLSRFSLFLPQMSRFRPLSETLARFSYLKRVEAHHQGRQISRA